MQIIFFSRIQNVVNCMVATLFFMKKNIRKPAQNLNALVDKVTRADVGKKGGSA